MTDPRIPEGESISMNGVLPMENLPVTSENSAILSVIERIAMSPDADIDKLERMLQMQERVMAKQSEIAFNQAMTRLQAKLPTISKKGMIEFTDKNKQDRQTPFARYEDIDSAIRPLMLEEGFSLSFDSEWNAEGTIIFGTLSHREGHYRRASMRLPLDTSGSKNNLQAMGSTISYGKRYLVCMLLNIVTKGVDDDGNSAFPIDIEKAVEIDQRLTAVKADKDKFLQYMGVASIPEINNRDYQKAINAIKDKERRNVAA